MYRRRRQCIILSFIILRINAYQLYDHIVCESNDHIPVNMTYHSEHYQSDALQRLCLSLHAVRAVLLMRGIPPGL